MLSDGESANPQQILGIRFFAADVDQAVARMSDHGGYLIAPSGTCFARLQFDDAYRQAVTQADVALPDSGAMVLLWRLFRGRKITRISGWNYIHHLSARLFSEKENNVLWILPGESARRKTTRWLEENRFTFTDDNFYIAPLYGLSVEDRSLLTKIDNRKFRHVVIGIGSGPQEKLGYFLREHLSYRPAIHCIGAALGFLTGDQVFIPPWADRFYLGWLLRLIAQPRVFIPRLKRALALPWLIVRYGESLPPMRARPSRE